MVNNYTFAIFIVYEAENYLTCKYFWIKAALLEWFSKWAVKTIQTAEAANLIKEIFGILSISINKELFII